MNDYQPVLKDRVALITGAARGIGRAVAAAYADAGATVVVADRDRDRGERAAAELRDRGAQADFAAVDLCSEEQIAAVVAACSSRHGRLDVVVNSARPWLAPAEFPDGLDEWDLALDVLLKAPTLVVRHALDALEASRGAVINLSSTNARTVSQQPLAYHVAKAGLEQLTRYLATVLGPRGVRVNALCPALVDVEEEGRSPLSHDPLNRAVVETVVPLRRAASAGEVAAAAVFLASDAAAYITGEVLLVDGGMTAGDHFRVAREATLRARDRDPGED